MDNQTPSLAAETEALREAYAALNRGDIPAFVKAFDPQIERIEPADFPLAGTYHGLDAVKAHISKGRGTWAEGSCEPERFIVAPPGGGGGDRIIVLIHVRVRLKTETEWRDGRIADVFTFRNGKAVQFRTFAEEREAFEWAGVKASGCALTHYRQDGLDATLHSLELGSLDMFGRRQNRNELDTPPVATQDQGAVEVLRVWAAPGKPQQLTLRPTWKDPAAWGLLLADVARHAANAYAGEGHNREEVLARIMTSLSAEWSHPSDKPEDITPR